MKKLMFGNKAKKWLEKGPQDMGFYIENLLNEVSVMRADRTIYPSQENILNAIEKVSPEEVKVVVVGQDPYHEPGQAMGLAFSVPEGCKLPPSLRNIYKELAADLECPVPVSGDLSHWAEQGVLLMNTVLTVCEHEANSHKGLGWQKVTNAILEICAALPQPVVFLAWGKPAVQLIENAVTPTGRFGKDKFILASTHPSPLSANRAGKDLPAFMGSRPFSQANAVLKAQGITPIKWA